MRCRIGVSISSFILPTAKISAAFMTPMMRASIKTFVMGREVILVYVYKKSLRNVGEYEQYCNNWYCDYYNFNLF